MMIVSFLLLSCGALIAGDVFHAVDAPLRVAGENDVEEPVVGLPFFTAVP
ncbi:hypothetical protein [Galliscardovia ingluviei]|nr:hypothetical protein [Galliscardovia ingluviei]